MRAYNLLLRCYPASFRNVIVPQALMPIGPSKLGRYQ
jgi:hypothetical protein